MDLDTEFQRIAGWLKSQNSGVERVQAAVASTETLLASAEYELAQLRRTFAKVRLDLRESQPKVVAIPPADPGAFEKKLRNPDSRKTPEWWAVLGLGQ